MKLHKLPWAKQILEGEDGKEKAKATAKRRKARQLCGHVVFAMISVACDVFDS